MLGNTFPPIKTSKERHHILLSYQGFWRHVIRGLEVKQTWLPIFSHMDSLRDQVRRATLGFLARFL